MLNEALIDKIFVLAQILRTGKTSVIVSVIVFITWKFTITARAGNESA